MKMLLNLTRSQQMALTDLIMEHMRCHEPTEQFINCSEAPAVVTTPAELLELVQRATPAAPQTSAENSSLPVHYPGCPYRGHRIARDCPWCSQQPSAPQTGYCPSHGEKLVPIFGGQWNGCPKCPRDADGFTPAAPQTSTARTDGWVSVEDGLPKATGVYGIYPPEQIDKDQGLNFSPRYFCANEDRNTYVGNKLAYGWVKDKNHKVTHWRELPAAPGSVPQAEPPK